MAFTCGICHGQHAGLPRDVAFAKPEAYLRLPEHSKGSAFITADVCVIENRAFFIRGVLYLPVQGEAESDGFGWGIWAEISAPSFTRCLELWEADATSEPPFEGSIASVIPGYAGTLGLPISVHLGTASQRPRFKVLPEGHPLFSEQARGITRAREHALLEVALPSLFTSPSCKDSGGCSPGLTGGMLLVRSIRTPSERPG